MQFGCQSFLVSCFDNISAVKLNNNIVTIMWCEHPVSLGYITMRITIQELCVYNLVLETTTVISVDVFAVYTCQLIDNIRI